VPAEVEWIIKANFADATSASFQEADQNGFGGARLSCPLRLADRISFLQVIVD